MCRSASQLTVLLQQAQTGDREARGKLLEGARPYLTLLARAQIGQRLQGKAEAADVVQETFVEALRVHGEERARLAVREQQRLDALEEGEEHLRQRRLTAARVSLSKAEGLLAGEESPATPRMRQLRQNLDLLAQLDRISLENARTDAGANNFEEQSGVHLYREALQAHGLQLQGPSEQVAEWVRFSMVAGELTAALETWAGLTQDKSERLWLDSVLRAVCEDEGEVIQQWRQAIKRTDREALMALAGQLDVEKLPAARVVRLARQLGATAGAELLRRAMRFHAGDFWINHELGMALMISRPPDVEGATRHLTAAVVLRPDSAGTWVNLGNALGMRAQIVEEKEADRRTALQRTREARRFRDEAISAFREAIRLRPDYSAAHNNLGITLLAKAKVEDGITEITPAEGGPPSAARFTAVLVKKDGEGYFESVRDSIPHPPSNAEHFEDLEWLLGDWKGESDKGESARASYHWAENRNFIVSSFATTTNVLTKVDADHATWQMTKLTVDGEAVPDAKPIKMKRVKPVTSRSAPWERGAPARADEWHQCGVNAQPRTITLRWRAPAVPSSTFPLRRGASTPHRVAWRRAV
jgi:tetratricopeptide (TPR) repeat protein